MNYIFKYSSIETFLHINVPTLKHSKNNHAKVKIPAINHAKVKFFCAIAKGFTSFNSWWKESYVDMSKGKA